MPPDDLDNTAAIAPAAQLPDGRFVWVVSVRELVNDEQAPELLTDDGNGFHALSALCMMAPYY